MLRQVCSFAKNAPLFLSLGCFAALALILPMVASAGTLQLVSDRIVSSAPLATTSSHTIRFTATTTIPTGGKIIITPLSTPGGSPFDIPALLDYTDLDMTVATSGGPTIERTLAAAPSATEDGVGVVSGTSGSITITLGSAATLSIEQGSTVVIEIGSAATAGAIGDLHIVNPATVGSYHISIVTTDAINTVLDTAMPLIAIVSPVTIGPIDTTDTVPPTLSNGLPTGLLPDTTAIVWLSLNTDKLATCRYATSSGVDYSLMSPSTTFSWANFGTLHYRSETVATNTIYNFYVRCANNSNIATTTDLLINFEIGVAPGTTTPPAPPPPPPSGGSGPSGGGGGGGLFLGKGTVTLDGRAAPLSTLVILKDGVIEKEVGVGIIGSFTEMFTGLDRGTYNWAAYIRDPLGKRSSTYSSTIYLQAQTNNIIAPIYLSPTIAPAKETVDPGESITLSGFAIPLLSVQVYMNKQGDALTGSIITASTTANGNGSWTLSIPTTGLSKGTYEIKAQSIVPPKDQSLLSTIAYVGVGEDPNVDLSNRADLNKDGKVNLVDFSILLFNWRTGDPVADINQDGTVNLVDFSIMLANWTG